MSQTKRLDKYQNLIIAAVATLILIVIVGIGFDYYYEFNDDVLMKDILSGAYTGVPRGLNIQMQAPISAFIALFYRIVPSVAWYGLFLCACHYFSLFLIIFKASSRMQRIGDKIISVIIGEMVFTVLCLPHLVMAQYTITVAIIAAAAAFCFYTIPEELTGRAFLKKTILPVVLLLLGYMIRSEMLLLMLPFVAATGFARWSKEKEVWSIRTFARYFAVVGMLFIGIGVIFVSNRVAYGSKDWKEFIRLFDNRTTLYDYQYVPDYEENRDFYDSIELSEAQHALLVNYDYAIDKNIDADVLGEVAEYAALQRNDKMLPRIPGALKEYIYRIIHFSDGIYSAISIFLYFMVLIAFLARKEGTLLYKIKISAIRLGGLFVLRSIPWMYIILGRRAPVRITHSLYIIEITVLSAFLVVEMVSKLKDRRYLLCIVSVVLICSALVSLPEVISNLKNHIAKQDQINEYAQDIDKYCASNPDNFYFEDVYSTIRDGESFNQKMFEDVDNTLTNYDIIGGWAAGSPLFWDKLSRFGISDIGEDILKLDTVYIISDMQYSMDWVMNIYADYGQKVEIEQVDVISDVFGVYKISESD